MCTRWYTWWLAHLSKGEENGGDASIGQVTGRWIQMYRTLTACVRSRWLGGTVARVYHRTLGCVRLRKNGFWPLLYSTRRWGSSVRSVLPERPVSFVAIEIWRTAFKASDTWHPSVDWTLSLGFGQFDQSVGQSAVCPVKGYNGSISWGLLFKPHGQLWLTSLAIFIDIATLWA